MDQVVLRAMAKWPDVPAVYGWLSLDARGRWRIKGESIGNPGIIEFIGRNYDHDEHGRWYFQNGPQRVYVDLCYVPFVLRVANPARPSLITHTGNAVRTMSGAWLDDQGRLILATNWGVGAVDGQDVGILAESFRDSTGAPLSDDQLIDALDRLQRGDESGIILVLNGRAFTVRSIRASEVPQRFGIEPHPRPEAGEEACT